MQEGFYSNRTDFIRTAIRGQLATHAAEVARTSSGRCSSSGCASFGVADLEAARAAGEMLHVRVVGLARIAAEVTPELARATIGSLTVLGALQASPEVKAALAGPDQITTSRKERAMSEEFGAAMRRALRAVRSGEVSEATGIIQQALGSGGGRSPEPKPRVPARSLREVRADARRRPAGVPGAGRAAGAGGRAGDPEGAAFLEAVHAEAAGSRRYRLYRPASLGGAAPRGLV